MGYCFTGFDGNNIPRVYGSHANRDVAETMCREEAMAYLRYRPNTGPLVRWSFTCEAPSRLH